MEEIKSRENKSLVLLQVSISRHNNDIWHGLDGKFHALYRGYGLVSDGSEGGRVANSSEAVVALREKSGAGRRRGGSASVGFCEFLSECLEFALKPGI